MSGEILPGATEAVGGVLEGFGHGGSYVAPVVGAGTDVHVVVDAALAEGTDEFHIEFQGEIVVAHADCPVHLSPGGHLLVGATEDAGDGVVVLDDLLPPFCRGVVLQPLHGQTAQIAADVIDQREELRVVDAIDRGGTSAHGETDDATMGTVRAGAVAGLDIRNEFLEEIVFVLPPGSIEVHHVLLVALGADENHLFHLACGNQAVGHLTEVSVALPDGVGLTAAVHEVEDGVAALAVLLIAGGQVDGEGAPSHVLKQATGHLGLEDFAGLGKGHQGTAHTEEKEEDSFHDRCCFGGQGLYPVMKCLSDAPVR